MRISGPACGRLGKAAGKEKEAEAAIAEAQGDLKDLKLLYATPPHPRVLVILSAESMMVAGKDSFVDEMITAAGGENLGAGVGRYFPDINREAVVNLAPEVLLIGAVEEPGMTLADPRLKTWANIPIPAVRNHRVYLVTDSNTQLASVNVAKQARMLAEMIHAGDAPAAPATTGGGARP